MVRTQSTLMGIVFLSLSALAGCGREEAKQSKDVQVVQVTAPGTQTDPKQQAEVPAKLRQTFQEATLAEPPEGVNRPPDRTAAGKAVAKMYMEIAGKAGAKGLWDQIRFVAPNGSRINYRAVIKTDLGDIHIELYPDVAPNHVRNFIALARVGYFDGLAFDRTWSQEINNQPWHYMEAGCPLSTGEAGYGSIGYWLKPEISDKVHHEVGTIGAWHGEAVETAACKFYVTLSKTPWMDGNYTIFGKITTGIDVARTIQKRPTQAGEANDRPLEPVIMRRVIIETSPEAPQVAQGN